MTKQILKELEPFVYTDESGNRVVKEDDLTALMCQYALSPDAMGRVHEALELLRIEVLPYGEEGDAEKCREIISVLEGLTVAADSSIEVLNPQQKQSVVGAIENIVPNLLHFRDKLKGRNVFDEVPAWGDYSIKKKSEQDDKPTGGGDGKDRTKYRFNGRVYNKKRLVLAVVYAYVAQNPSVTVNQMSYMFPDNLQGNRGVVREVSIAKRECRDCDVRHFTKPDEVIELVDGKIFVCTQWGIGNLPNFIDRARKLGFTIEEA